MKLLAVVTLAVALFVAPAVPLAETQQPTVLTVARPAGSEWFGLYLLGKKAGWSRTEITREQRGGADILVARQETYLRATLAGRQVERRERDEKVYEARPGGRLLSLVSEREGDGGSRRTELACTPSVCRAAFTAEDGTRIRELPPTAETVEQADGARLAAARRATVTGTQLEPERLREKRMKDVFERRTKLGGAGVEVPVSIVAESSDEDRVPARAAIADDGRIVELRLGESIVARAEPEEIAKRLDKVDLFNLSRVPLPAPLPRSVPGRVVYRLWGMPPEFQKPDGRQTTVAAANGDILLTVSARQPAASTPGHDAPRPASSTAQLREFLEPTPDSAA